MSVFDDSGGIDPGTGIILDHVRRARMALIDPLAVVAGSPESSVLVGQIEEALNRLRSTECDGAAFLAAECLALARLLPALPSVRRREAAGVLGIGLDQVADLAGGGGEPAHGRTWELAQMLNELRAARGRPLVSESAVFTPGLAGAIAADGGAPALGDIGIADAVGRERMVFHRGMVLWYGEGDVERGLRKLRRVARNLARAAGSAALRRLFFVLEALFIGIADDTVFAGVAVRHLLADVDQLLRRLARDGESAVAADFPGGLLRNLLFYVAGSSSGHRIVQAAREAHRLDAPDAGTVAGLLEDLRASQSALRACRGQPDAHRRCAEPLQRLSDGLGIVGLDLPRRVVLGLIDRLRPGLAAGGGKDGAAASEALDALAGIASLVQQRDAVKRVAGPIRPTIAPWMAGGTEPRRAQVREALQRLREDAAAVARAALGERPAVPADGAASVTEPVDGDILDVFLEEAAEQLAALRAAQAAWRDAPRDRDALTAMAAALQNLKGPSRLVGALTLGELAWAVEAVVRRLAESGGATNEGIVRLVDDGVAGLDALARSYRTGEPVAHDPREVEARAYRWLSSGVLTGAAASPSSPVSIAQRPRAAGEASEAEPLVDAELGSLLAAEADDLLDVLGESLDDLAQRPGAIPLAQGRRALEALSASARMTRVPTLATAAEALEALLGAAGVAPGAGTLALAREAAAAMRGTVDALRDGQLAEVPADLVGRLHAAQQEAAASAGSEPTSLAVQPDTGEALAAPPEPAAAAEPAPLRWVLEAPHPFEAPAGGVRVRRTVRVPRELLARLDGEARALAGQQMRLEAGVDGLRTQVWHLRALAGRLGRAAAAREGGRSGVPQDLAELAVLTDDIVGLARELSGLLGAQRNRAEGVQSATSGLRQVELASRVPLLQRVLRRTAKALDRSVALRVAGESHPIDRELLDRLTPCLTELVRNAVAHGVEAPEGRRTAGKPESGAVVLECVEEGAMLALSVADDGAGLTSAAGFEDGRSASREQLSTSLRSLLESPRAAPFAEGKASAVQDLRDVWAVVHGLGGAVDLASWPGVGTRITLRVPRGPTQRGVVLARVGDAVVAVPDGLVGGIDRLSADAAVEIVPGGARWTICHGERRRLVDLAGLLPGGQSARPPDRGRQPVILLRLPGEPVALAVDALVDSRRVVVDPLPPPLGGIPWLVGGTVLGDGRVALVLDIPTLLRGAV